MFNKSLTIGRHRIVIRLNGALFSSRNGYSFFGFPLGGDLNHITNETIAERLNAIKGYFLFICVEPQRLIIANDITGGYRLYTCHIDGTTYYSDDWHYLFALLKQDNRVELDQNEYDYWYKHRYTTGGATYIRRLRKLEPASIVEVSPAGISTRCYFQDIRNFPNAATHCDLCLQDLQDTVSRIASATEEIVLFFSGGLDSTLLALLFKDINRNIALVNIKSHPLFWNNFRDHVRAKAVAKYLGLPLRVIKVNLDEGLRKMSSVAQIMPFDRHFALLHFSALEQLRDKHQGDTVIVSGQGADSVLSFGPSMRRKGDFAARVLMYRPFGVLARLAAEAVRYRHGQWYFAPKNPEAYLNAFFDQFEYYTVLSTRDPDNYRDYVDAVVKRIASRMKNKDALLMYLKIYGFLQGSDNQVVLKSAQAAGYHKVIMPYVSPIFIYNTVQYKDKIQEIITPKYVIRRSAKALCRTLTRSHFITPRSDELSQKMPGFSVTPEGDSIANLRNSRGFRQEIGYEMGSKLSVPLNTPAPNLVDEVDITRRSEQFYYEFAEGIRDSTTAVEKQNTNPY
jgi:hypothetical protein